MPGEGKCADAKGLAGLPAEAPAKAGSRPENATVERRKASVRFAVQAQRTRRASPARLTRAERRDEDEEDAPLGAPPTPRLGG